MSDVAISYKSEERDRAHAAAETLRRAGLVVWLDEAAAISTGAEAFGVAPGQRWRAALEDAFTAAALVLILDSPAWRSSEICWLEYEFANRMGKRIAVLPPTEFSGLRSDRAPVATWPITDLDDLIERFDEHAEVVRAHTELTLSAVTEPGRWNRVVAFLLGSRDVRNAETVLSARSATTGITVSPDLAAHAEAILNSDRGRRRRRLLLAAALIVVLLLTSGTAVGFALNAASSRSAAETSARQQLSLLLVQQALEANNTADAQRLLAEAGAADDNTPELQAARSQIAALTAQRTTSWVSTAAPDDPYIAVALSEDGNWQAVTTRGQLTVFDTRRGTVIRRQDLPAPAQPMTLKYASGGRVIVGLADGLLMALSPDGSWSQLARDVSSFAVDGHGAVWSLTKAGNVSHDGRQVAVSLPSDQVGTAIAVNSSGNMVTLLYSSGSIQRFIIDGARIAAAPPVQVFTNAQPQDPGGVSALLSCGHLLAAYQRGRIAYQPDEDAAIEVAGDGTDEEAFARSLACFRDAVIVQNQDKPTFSALPSTAMRPASLFLDTDTDGVALFASNVTGTKLSVLHPNGRLEVSDVANMATATPSPEVHVVLPLPGSLITVAPDGATYINGRQMTGSKAVEMPIRERNPAVLGQRAAVVGENAVIVLGRDGVLSRHRPTQQAGVDFVRTSARDHFIASTGYGFFELDPLKPSSIEPNVRIEGLIDDEAVTDVDAADFVIVATSHGRLLKVEPRSGQILLAREAVAPSPDFSVAVSADGRRVFALGGDGIITEYDIATLEPLRSSWVGAAARTLRYTPSRRLLIAATAADDIRLINPADLQTVQMVSQFVRRSVSYVADGTDRNLFGVFNQKDRWFIQRIPLAPVQ